MFNFKIGQASFHRNTAQGPKPCFWSRPLVSQQTGHGTQRCWKPTTLRAPVLGFLIVVSISLIAILEILSSIGRRDSNRNSGGLAFASDADSLSNGAKFGYLYLPTILAVLYSLAWSWVDLDAKRLEPWFQLSKTTGALAQDSINLSYPTDFLPFVPITAAQRKHWRVFFSGTAMLMVFWIITPLQSSIFNTRTITRSAIVQMVSTSELLPTIEQTKALSVNFLNTAYGVAWLNQKLPEFTTRTQALLPFRPISATTTLTQETWRASTDVYSTTLACTPANATLVGGHGHTYDFDNGRGCVVRGIASFDSSRRYWVNYIGWYDDPELDYFLKNPECLKEHSNNFLAIYAEQTAENTTVKTENLTAVFCVPSYHINRATVTVNATDNAVIDVSVIHNATETSTPFDHSFNTSLFEYIVGSGVSPLNLLGRDRDYADLVVVQQFPRIDSLDILWPTSNVVGFALGISPIAPSALLNPATIQKTFEKAHQVLFSAAFSELTRPLNHTQIPQYLGPGIRQDTPGAIVLVRTIAIIVEVGLAVILLFTCFFWYSSYTSPLNLSSEPASIMDVLSFARADNDMLNDLKQHQMANSSELEEATRGNKYRLVKNNQGIAFLESIARTPGSTTTRSTHNSHGSAFLPVKPSELRLYVGAGFVLIIIAGISAIIALEILSAKNNGIKLPSHNLLVRSIIENFAPTMFATFLESVWVILNRLLCLLYPFEQLRRGNAKQTSSVGAKYTSLPPQLTFWRALRSGHFLLASVCIITLSANVLAVVLSALLSERPVLNSIPFNSKQMLSTQLNRTRESQLGFKYQDHFYVALSNITGGTTLPSWSDQNFAYIPFDLSNVNSTGYPKSDFQSIRGNTTGFGTKFTCVEIFPTEGGDTISIGIDGTSSTMQSLGIGETGNSTTCKTPGNTSRSRRTWTSTTYPPSTRYAMEFWDSVEVFPNATKTRANTEICPMLTLAGFIRAGGRDQNSTTENDQNVSSTWISCSPSMEIAPFELTVDLVGKVISSKQIGNFAPDVSSFFTNNTNQTAFFAELMPKLVFDAGSSHNDSFPQNWLTSLLQRSLNTSAIADPNADVPKASLLAPRMEILYRQFFATYLALNPTMFFPASHDAPGITAEVTFRETRIFVSSINSKISLVIIILNLLVAVFYYANRPRMFLPRMPTSIASVMAYVAASRAAGDFSLGGGTAGFKGKEERYGYGRFVGADGKTYVGVEKMRYVVPLESKNPEVDGRGWMGMGLLRRRRGGREGGEKWAVKGEKVKSWI